MEDRGLIIAILMAGFLLLPASPVAILLAFDLFRSNSAVVILALIGALPAPTLGFLAMHMQKKWRKRFIIAPRILVSLGILIAILTQMFILWAFDVGKAMSR